MRTLHHELLQGILRRGFGLDYTDFYFKGLKETIKICILFYVINQMRDIIYCIYFIFQLKKKTPVGNSHILMNFLSLCIQHL